jgi:hypothetical protein
MFIVWGQKAVTKKLGRVAQWCPLCQEARACTLREHRTVGHLYYIPLGRGTVQGHTVRCDTCREATPTDLGAYTAMSNDRRASLEQLVDATNPTLPDEIAQRLDAWDRALSGELSEDERLAMIAQPFLDIASSVEARASQLHIDARTGLAVFSLFITVPAACIAASVLIKNDRTLLIAIITLLLLLSSPVIYLAATDVRRFAKRRYRSHLHHRLAQLVPTLDELTEVIFRLRHAGLRVGRIFKPAWLHHRLTRSDVT